jgi:hypothetical protein
LGICLRELRLRGLSEVVVPRAAGRWAELHLVVRPPVRPPSGVSCFWNGPTLRLSKVARSCEGRVVDESEIFSKTNFCFHG